MMNRDEIERALNEILPSMGVRAVGTDRKVQIDPDRDELMVRIGLPPIRVDVEIERDQLAMHERAADYLMRCLDNGVKRLMYEVVQHIAKHDRSPIDRVQSLERAATALIEALGVGLDDIRMPYGVSAKVQSAVYDLATLVKLKLGAASWSRTGYGEEVKEGVYRVEPPP
jgi:hypothetical protein